MKKQLDKILKKIVRNHKQINQALIILYLQPIIILAVLFDDIGKFLILSSMVTFFHIWVRNSIIEHQIEEIDAIITAGTELVLEEYELKNNKQKEKKC